MSEDNQEILLLAILMLIFACIIAHFDDNISLSEPLFEQKDSMLNKWKRIY